jgi:hypothetical protein
MVGDDHFCSMLTDDQAGSHTFGKVVCHWFAPSALVSYAQHFACDVAHPGRAFTGTSAVTHHSVKTKQTVGQ